MTRLKILHSSPAVAASLTRTLASAWPGIEITEAQDADLILSDKAAPKDAKKATFTLDGQPRRLKALVDDLRRLEQNLSTPKKIDLDGYTLDTMTRQLFTPKGPVFDLTEKEVSLIVYLFKRKVSATRDDLLRDVWNYAADADTHTIETHIYRLRQKIEPSPEHPEFLLTTKEGYQLAACSSA